MCLQSVKNKKNKASHEITEVEVKTNVSHM